MKYFFYKVITNNKNLNVDQYLKILTKKKRIVIIFFKMRAFIKILIILIILTIKITVWAFYIHDDDQQNGK